MFGGQDMFDVFLKNVFAPDTWPSSRITPYSMMSMAEFKPGVISSIDVFDVE